MTSIGLTVSLRRYLCDASFIPPELHEELERKLAPSSEVQQDVLLEDNVVIRLGDLLTERLARVGFDSDNRITDEGVLLEELISRLVK